MHESILWYLITYGGNLIEWYIAVTFFSALHAPRLARKWRVLCGFGITTIQFVCNALFLSQSVPTVIVSYCMVCLYSMLYRSKWYWKLLESAAVCLINVASEFVIGLILQMGMKVDLGYAQHSVGLYALCTLVSKSAAVVILKLTHLGRIRKSLALPGSAVYPILALPLGTVITMALLLQSAFYMRTVFYTAFTMLSVVLLLAANLLTFRIIERQSDYARTKQALQFAEAHMQVQLDHYRELYDYQTQMRRTRHDEKNRLIALSALLHAGEYEKAQAQIDRELAQTREDALRVVNTGNPVIDAVLQQKRRNAQEKGIEIRAGVQLDEPLRTDALELGVLLGNALDNATEAAEKLDSGETPTVDVLIRAAAGRVLLCVDNPTAEESGDTDVLRSTKPDAKNHGFGLSSIRAIAGRHDGSVTITWRNHRFRIEVGLANEA